MPNLIFYICITYQWSPLKLLHMFCKKIKNQLFCIQLLHRGLHHQWEKWYCWSFLKVISSLKVTSANNEILADSDLWQWYHCWQLWHYNNDITFDHYDIDICCITMLLTSLLTTPTVISLLTIANSDTAAVMELILLLTTTIVMSLLTTATLWQ